MSQKVNCSELCGDNLHWLCYGYDDNDETCECECHD